MTQEQTQAKSTPDYDIAIQARIWRAIDKVACKTPPRSPERDAEYVARQELRKVIDEKSGGHR